MSDKLWKTEWQTAKNWVRKCQKLCEKLSKTKWGTADIYWGQINAIAYRLN